jgi:hypothetical protein
MWLSNLNFLSAENEIYLFKMLIFPLLGLFSQGWPHHLLRPSYTPAHNSNVVVVVAIVIIIIIIK